MTKRNTTAYWLLLTGILLLVTAAMLTRPTRSHYINTTVWNTAMYPEESAPVSNCLVAGGQTILLGELELTNELGEAVISRYPFTLSDPTGTLDWSVSYSDGSQGSYLTAVVTTTETAEGTVDAALELTPDLTVAHPEVTADITVTWTVGLETLRGVFRVTVPEVVVELPEETPEEPPEEVPEENPEQQPEENPEAETPAVAATPGTVVLTVTAPETYDAAGLLPVHIGVEGTVSAIYLGIPRISEGDVVTMGELPAFTRYSLDGGTSYILMYHGGLIELTSGGTVLLDFGATALDMTAAQTLYVQTYNEENLVQEAQFAATAAAILPQERAVTPRVVTAAEGISIALPGQWSDAELTWTISGRNADGTYSVMEDPAAAGLTVEKITGESGDSLNIQKTPQGEITPVPGTYKLQLQWSWQGVPFAGTQLTFFVNYVVDAQA